MPLGNGEVGANVWMDHDGYLHVYLSKTDAWSGNGRLLKIGKIRLQFEPNIIQKANFYQQTLELENGCLRMQLGNKKDSLEIKLWINAYYPVLHIDAHCNHPLIIKVFNENWRTDERRLEGQELRSAYGLQGFGETVREQPDVFVPDLKDRMQWYHQNNHSIYPLVLKGQGLGNFKSRDPLLHRIFGATVFGKSLVALSAVQMVSEQNEQHRINIWVNTSLSGSAESWKEEVETGIHKLRSITPEERWQDHVDWWRKFWDRHWIFVESKEQKDSVFRMAQAYNLQRYVTACAGRGAMPIKFNGSIFNVDLVQPLGSFPKGYNADFRNWGGCYWFQNTRLPYWTMLHSGDREFMIPLFRMYMDAMDLARYRTYKHYDHEGVCFPETMYFWGTWNMHNYGWERSGLQPGISRNKYIRHEWQGGLELLAMMMDYYTFLPDTSFRTDTLIPFANEVLLFYDKHYQRDGNGKILFDPAQALETYWEGTVNPMPEIAGLHYLLPKLADLAVEAKEDGLYQLSMNLLSQLPDLPLRVEGKDTLLGAGHEAGRETQH